MIPVIWRRAIRIAVAVLIGVLGYEYFQLSYGFWTPLAILLVMQDTSGATLRRGCQRLMGLLFGRVIGFDHSMVFVILVVARAVNGGDGSYCV